MNYATRETVKKAARFNGWTLVVVAGMIAIGIAAKAASDTVPARHFSSWETVHGPSLAPAREMR